MRNAINVLTFFIRINCIQLYCLNVSLFPNEVILPISDYAFFIGTDHLNISQLTSNQQEYFHFSHVSTIENPIDYSPIQVIQVKSKISYFFTQYCWLLKNLISQYEILCKDGFRNYFVDNKLDFNYTNNSTLKIQTQYEEICEYLFEYSNQQFQVICFSDNYFKLITIHQQQNEISFNNTPSLIQCKRQVFKAFDIIVVNYYQCQEWIIYIIYNEQPIYLINKEFLNISEQVLDIQYCQDFDKLNIQLVLVHPDSYSTIVFNQVEFYVNSLNQKVADLSYIFLQDCNIYIVIQQEKLQKIYQYDNPLKNKTIDLLNQKIEQIFIFDNSQLAIIYENKIKIIFPQDKSLNFNYTLLSFERVKFTTKDTYDKMTNNYFFALDAQSKNLLFFQIEIIQSTSEVINLSQKHKYLLEISQKNFLDEEFRVEQCLTVNLIQESSNKLQVNYLENSISFQKETQTHQLFKIDKKFVDSTMPMNFSLESNFSSIVFIDQITLQDFCNNINMKVLDDSLYFHTVYFPNRNIIISQQFNSLVFLDCLTNKITQYKLKFSQIQESIIIIYDQIVILSEDHKNLFVFSAKNEIILLRSLKFDDPISKIKVTQNQQILIYFLNCSQLQQLNLWELTIKMIDFDEYPLQLPVLYYKRLGGYQIIQSQNLLYLSEKRKMIFFIVSIPHLEIVYEFLRQSLICFIGVHAERDLIIKYCMVDQKALKIGGNFILKELFQYPMFGYQIYRPLKFSIFQETLVLAVFKQNKQYLYAFHMEGHYINGLKEIIEVNNFKFSILNDNLIYYDKNNKLAIKNLRQYWIKIPNNEICENLQSSYHFTFTCSSIENQDQFLDVHISLTTIGSCSINVMLKKENQVIQMKGSIGIIQPNDIVQGRISNLSLLTDNTETYKLQGPFNFIKQFTQCKYYGEFLCKSENQTFIYVIDDDKERRIPLEQENQQILFLSLKNKEQSLIVITQFLSIVGIHNFARINGTFIEQNNQYFNSFESNQNVKITGQICIVQDNQNRRVLHTNNSELITVINSRSDLIFVQESEENYLIVTPCEFPCILIFEITQLIDLQFKLIGRTQIYQELISESLKKINVQIENIVLFDVLLVSAEEISKQKYRILVYLSCPIIYSYLNEIIIDQMEIISFSVKKIIRHSSTLNIQFLDFQFMVAQEQKNSFHQLFDFRGSNFMIDTIYSSYSSFSIHSFNNTHYILIVDEISGIGYIEYEIKRQTELLTDDTNTTVIIKAVNEVSTVEFNLTIQQQRPTSDTLRSTPIQFMFFIVLIFICICFIMFLRRRKQLQQLNLA